MSFRREAGGEGTRLLFENGERGARLGAKPSLPRAGSVMAAMRLQQGTAFSAEVIPGAIFDLAAALPGSSRFFGGLRVQGRFFRGAQMYDYQHTPSFEFGGTPWFVGIGDGARVGPF